MDTDQSRGGLNAFQNLQSCHGVRPYLAASLNITEGYMTHYILTFIIGAQVGGIIALLWDQRQRRLFREEYANKIKELR